MKQKNDEIVTARGQYLEYYLALINLYPFPSF